MTFPLPNVQGPRHQISGDFIDPSSLDDSIWLDFSDPATMTASDDNPPNDGDVIKTITAKGSYINPPVFTEQSSGQGPIYRGAGYGQNTTQRGLIREATFFSSDFASQPGVCVYGLMQADASSTSYLLSEGSSSTNNVVICPMHFTSLQNVSAWLRDASSGEDLAAVMVTGVNDNTLRVFGTELDMIGETYAGYNEAAIDQSGSFASPIGTYGADRSSIGVLYRQGFTGNATVNIYQLVLVPRGALTNEERTNLVNWLLNKIP